MRFMDTALAKYIETDLYNELRWLLCAAAEWDAHDKLIGEPPQVPKIQERCFHLKVYAMDSALLHARSLYEFFTATEDAVERNVKKDSKLTWRDYSFNGRQESRRYSSLIKTLHGRVLHIAKDRPRLDEVKKEVVSFASDILDLWDGFSKNPDLGQYSALLDRVRKESIGEAAKVGERYKAWGYKSPFPIR
jgi:hypothetical protein